MGIKDDLVAEVKNTFESAWTVEPTTVVPDAKNLRLNANHAKDLSLATVLYADLDGSTNMVDTKRWEFSAQVYKSYLRCAADIIRSEGGTITAYDGDRVMAVFTGDVKNTTAVRCALKINYAALHIIQPAIKKQYTTDFEIKHVVGIDTSQLRASRVGVRGDNDLVWIGRAANYAAKLASLSGNPTWITKAVFDAMNADVKTVNGTAMWKEYKWTQMNDIPVYASTYFWHLT